MPFLPYRLLTVLSLGLAIPALALAQGSAAGTTESIDTVKQSAMESSAVTVTGRVEDVDTENNSFTLSDDSGEIDISTITPPAEVQEGQQVRVSGTVSEPTSGEKNIVASSIEVLGVGETQSEGKRGSQEARQPR